MTRSKLTHADKDIIIAELETTLANISTVYEKQITTHTKFVMENTVFITKQHEIVEKLIKECNAAKAVNWLVTTVLGLSIGVNIYLIWF